MTHLLKPEQIDAIKVSDFPIIGKNSLEEATADAEHQATVDAGWLSPEQVREMWKKLDNIHIGRIRHKSFSRNWILSELSEYQSLKSEYGGGK